MTSLLKILCIGDPHFKPDNKDQTELMEQQIVNLIIAERPKLIVLLGDTLHTHERVNLHCLKRAVEFFRSIFKVISSLGSDHYMYILIGNHDRPNNNVYMTDEHPFNSLKEWGPNVIVVDSTYVGVHEDFNFAFVPYVQTGRFNEALLTKDLSSPFPTTSAIFAHQEFKGAKMNSITSNVGDEYPLNNPICISGHIHDYDELQSNLIYVGTPIQHGFADRNDKSISMFTFEGIIGGERMYVTEHKRIQLKIPKKLNIKLTPEEFMEYKYDETSQVKITLHGDPELVKQVLMSSHAEQLLDSGVKLKDGAIKNSYKPSKVAITKLNITFSKRLVSMLSSQPEQIQNTFVHLFPNAPLYNQND